MLVNVNDDVALGRIYPPGFVVEPGAGADGVGHLVGGGHDVCSVLHDELERLEDVAAALGVEPGGVDVTVDRGAVQDAVGTREA